MDYLLNLYTSHTKRKHFYLFCYQLILSVNYSKCFKNLAHIKFFLNLVWMKIYIPVFQSLILMLSGWSRIYRAESKPMRRPGKLTRGSQHRDARLGGKPDSNCCWRGLLLRARLTPSFLRALGFLREGVYDLHHVGRLFNTNLIWRTNYKRYKLKMQIFARFLSLSWFIHRNLCVWSRSFMQP